MTEDKSSDARPELTKRRRRIGIISAVLAIAIGATAYLGLIRGDLTGGPLSGTAAVPDDPQTYFMYPGLCNLAVDSRWFNVRPLTGEMTLTAYSYATADTYLCDGSSRKPWESDKLFSTIGYRYGKSGDSLFKLPKLSAADDNGRPLAYQVYRKRTSPQARGKDESFVIGDIRYYPCHGLPSFVDGYIGEIFLIKDFDDERNPDVLPCDGRTLQMAEYPKLSAVIGNTFGGDGQTTFNVPDLSSRSAPIEGAKYYIAVRGVSPVRI